MEKWKKIIEKLTVPATLFFLPILSFAADVIPPGIYTPPGTGLTLSGIQQIINTVANTLMVVGVVIAVIFIIWGGIKYMAAKGDETSLKSAKDSIYRGVIGAAVVLGVGVILRTVGVLVTRSFFGAGQ